MTADAQGNDLTAVKNVVTSKIIIAPYAAGKQLTASQIASTVADPETSLKSVFGTDQSASSPVMERRRTRATPTTRPNSISPATK